MRLLRAISVVLLLALPAGGADLTFSLQGAGQYDTNVFRSSTNEQQDFLFLFLPAVRLEEERETDLSYFLDYRAPAEISTRFYDNVSGVDQFVDFGGNWHANDRMTFFMRNNFRWSRNLSNQLEFGAEDPGGEPIINTERDRVTTNVFNLGGNYLFTPRLSASVDGGFGYFDSTRDDRSRVWSGNATGKASYVLHPQHQLGGGFRYTHQDFSGYPGQVGSRTNIYYFFGDWGWQITETLRFSANIGPAVFGTRQNDTPPVGSTDTVPTNLQVTTDGFVPDPSLGIQDLTTGQLITGANPANTGDVIVGRLQNSASGSPGCPTVPDPNTGNPQPVIIAQQGQFGCPSGILVRSNDVAALNQIQAPIILLNSDPIGAENTSVTLFAGVSLLKRWTPNLITALRYSRDQGIASGVGGAVVRDGVSLTTNWDFAERWELLFRGDWTLRQSESLGTSQFGLAQGLTLAGADPSVPQAAALQGTVITQQLAIDSINTQRWGIAGEVAHRLTKRTRVSLRLQYNQQTSQRLSLGQTSDFDDFLATLGVRYTWDPIHVW